MADFEKLSIEALDSISGGDARMVNTGRNVEAVVRSGAGFAYPQIAALKNGTFANITGRSVRNDGRTWYEINTPVYGWIAGGILGLPYRY